jgi:hypothetical protein
MTSRQSVRRLSSLLSPKVWVGLAIVIGPVCLFGPGMLQGRVLFWGTPMLQFEPWRQFAIASLLSGHIALWNPLVGLGAPLLANYQSALLYPPSWLQALVGVAWGQALMVSLHLVWAGVGMTYLSRRIGLQWLSAAVAGLAFSLSGYVVSRSGFLSINASVAWLPWIIATVDGLSVSDHHREGLHLGRGIYVLPVAAFTFQWLAGHAQIAWYTLLLAIAWSTWRSLQLGGRTAWVAALGRLSLVLALSFCLAAPQLLPTLEYMAHSQRATAVSRDLAMTYSFWPWRLTGLLTPSLFGSPVTGDFWGYGNYWEDAIYVGVLPLCLALTATWRGIRGWGSKPHLTRFLIVLSVVSLVLALGKNTPIFPFLYDHVPTFSLFQAPARWSIWLVFSLSVLAAIGVDDWSVATGRSLYWLRLGTAGAFAIALGAGLAAVMLTGIRSTFIRAAVVASVWLGGAGVIALTRRTTPGGLWKGAAAAMVVVDLTIAGWGLNPFGAPDLYAGASSMADRLPAGSRVYMSPDVEYVFKYETVFRFDTFRPDIGFKTVADAGLANALMPSGLASLNNFDPILPARYVAWMDAFSRMPDQQRSRWLGAMNVGMAALESAPDGRPIYTQTSPMGPAWFVGQAESASSPEEAFKLASDPAFDPAHELVIEGRIENPPNAGSPQGAVVALETSDSNEIHFRTENDDGGWLVISAMDYPGWRASIDGQPARMYAADYILEALWVPAGTHDVVLHYHSLPFGIGLGLSAAGLLLSAIWLLRRRNTP